MIQISKELKSNSYHGRGIIVGVSENGEAAISYFIMGRSENSRNRIFQQSGETVRTAPFDPAKCSDPSLIIYNAVRVLGNKTIISNGDQTDTICELMDKQYSFEQSLRGREYEPDSPNYTPRISAVMRHDTESGEFNYAVSILKKGLCKVKNSETLRYNFAYSYPVKGIGRFIHTYSGEENGVLLPFSGEPKEVVIKGGIDEFTSEIWDNLNTDNKISLFTKFIAPDGKSESKIINKYK